MRTGTVIYTVDTRGQVTGQQDASRSRPFDPTARLARVNTGEVTASQDGLNALAADTGGRPWFNSDALDPGITQALAETSAYYLLAWQPENEAQRDDRFRHLEVRVKGRPDLVVRARSGYFSEPPAGNTTPAKAGSADEELQAALRSSYPRRGLPVALTVGYMHVPNVGATLAVGAQVAAAPAGAGGSAPPTEVDLAGAVANDSGSVVAALKQHLSAESGRLVYTTQLPLAPGLYQVCVAARDARSGRIGSVAQWLEIPDLKQGKFTLGSIFLSELPAGGARAAQKPALNPARRFSRTSVLRFQAEAYNAAQSGARPALALQVQLLRDGQPLITTPPSLVSLEGVTDFGRIPVGAEFPLAELQPGRYTLLLTLTESDRQSHRRAADRLRGRVTGAHENSGRRERPAR